MNGLTEIVDGLGKDSLMTGLGRWLLALILALGSLFCVSSAFASDQDDFINPQTLINRAEPGALVTIPPGIYPQGLVVSKSLTLNLQGVVLTGTEWNKGVVVIENPGGPVMINDLEVDGAVAGADQANLAGVRISGSDFDVSLNRARIRRCAMAVLTDNRGGVLRVTDSALEDSGLGNVSGQLSHVIYAGLIDRLEISGSRLAGSYQQGHLVKSRARETLIEDSQLLGEDTRHSRIVDLPCGGLLYVSGSYLQRSEHADNLDLLAFGQESALACGGEVRSIALELTDSVLDLGSENNEPWHIEPVFLFNFARPAISLVVERNQIVTHGKLWLTQVPGDGSLFILPNSNARVRALESEAESLSQGSR